MNVLRSHRFVAAALRLAAFSPWLLVTACRRDPPVVADDPSPPQKKVGKKPQGLLERYPLRMRATSTLRETSGGKTKTIPHEWTCTKTDDEPPTFSCESRDLEPDGFVITMRYRLLAQGLVYDRATTSSGVRTIDPPKLELPIDAHVGQKWSGTHENGPRKEERSCEIAAYEGCADGIVVECRTSNDEGRKVHVKNRYCGGVGYVGGEGRSETAGGKTFETIELDVKSVD